MVSVGLGFIFIASIIAPANGSTVSINDFNLTISASDYPDFALWAELRISLAGLSGFSVPIPIVLMKNGEWSTSSLSYWSLIRKAIHDAMDWDFLHSSFSVTLSLKAVDFVVTRYSNEVSVTFTLTK